MPLLCEDCINTHLQPSIIPKNFRRLCPRTPVSPAENFIKKGGEGNGKGVEARGPAICLAYGPQIFNPALHIGLPLDQILLSY
jgi:hypothetical protein